MTFKTVAAEATESTVQSASVTSGNQNVRLYAAVVENSGHKAVRLSGVPNLAHFANMSSEVSVRLVDTTGESQTCNVVTFGQAKLIAEQTELDLILVDAGGDYPVFKLMEYGKFNYLNRSRKSDRKQANLKTLRLGPKTFSNDWNRIVGEGLAFLKQGHTVKFVMRLNGRFKTDLKGEAKAKLAGVVTDLAEFGNGSDITSGKNSISITITPINCVSKK